MLRRLRFTTGLLLLAVRLLLLWSGVVVGLRAFEPHPDSPPALYLTSGGIYIALGAICGAGSGFLLWKRR